MNDVFNRVMKLALRTGDKVIVVDPSQAKPYVMMDFDDYEKLIARPNDNVADEIMKSDLRMSGITDRAVKGQPTEPGVVSALAGSDPLEPDSVSPASVDMKKIKLSEPSTPLETEEHFYLESIED
ncbi:MAG: hypothetical protein U9P90_00395 [Patescibacteria group bacterium]|nr:hypothetical protein [Patescibacteria group bacterium]